MDGWLWGAASISVIGGAFLTFRRACRNSPVAKEEALSPALTGETVKAIEAELAQVETGATYPSCSALPKVLHEAARDPKALRRSKAWADAQGQTIQVSRAFAAFAHDPEGYRQGQIQAFVHREGQRWAEFFDTVEKQPLTSEQRLAVLSDADATLILAGAGSGKTSVITAKVSTAEHEQTRNDGKGPGASVSPSNGHRARAAPPKVFNEP